MFGVHLRVNKHTTIIIALAKYPRRLFPIKSGVSASAVTSDADGNTLTGG